jgi:hypothetical protein
MNIELLLQHAKGILEGAPQASPRQNRITAFLIRQALEAEVGVRCEHLAARIDHPVRMRSRLLVLHVLAPSEVAGKIDYAWNALSRACHHHAYELAPTVSELRYLHSLVTDLVESRSQAAPGEGG